MTHLSWTKHGCSTMIPTIHDALRHNHRRNRPIVCLLQTLKKECRAARGVCVTSRPTTHSTIHFFHDVDQSRKRATVQTTPRFVYGLTNVTCHPDVFVRSRNPHLAQRSWISLGSTPKSIRLRHGGGSTWSRAVDRNTNPVVDTHLMSNASGPTLAISRIAHSRRVFAPHSKVFIHGNFQCGPHVAFLGFPLIFDSTSSGGLIAHVCAPADDVIVKP